MSLVSPQIPLDVRSPELAVVEVSEVWSFNPGDSFYYTVSDPVPLNVSWMRCEIDRATSDSPNIMSSKGLTSVDFYLSRDLETWEFEGSFFMYGGIDVVERVSEGGEVGEREVPVSAIRADITRWSGKYLRIKVTSSEEQQLRPPRLFFRMNDGR